MHKIALGGSCHWCTEAIFQSLKGVEKVEQGWIASEKENDSFSEGIIIHYTPDEIDLSTLIAVHLYTHKATEKHSFRDKYRSAIYYYTEEQQKESTQAIINLQAEFNKPIITQVLPFIDFKLNKEEQLNYYYSNPEKPFCESYINPKLRLIREKFSKNINQEKLKHL